MRQACQVERSFLLRVSEGVPRNCFLTFCLVGLDKAKKLGMIGSFLCYIGLSWSLGKPCGIGLD